MCCRDNYIELIKDREFKTSNIDNSIVIKSLDFCINPVFKLQFLKIVFEGGFRVEKRLFRTF